MKNIVIIDFDSERQPSLLMGKPNSAAIDTGKSPQYVADLDTVLSGLIVQMRVAEKAGAKTSELMERVIAAIEKGMFDANLKICKGK